MATVSLSTKAAGSIVKLNVNGVSKEFLVVQQGQPSALYDAVWSSVVILLMKDDYGIRVWDDLKTNDYGNSSIHSYLNNSFLNLLDTNIRNALITIKLPYRAGSGTSSTITSGSNGLSAKAFLLSGYEVGLTSSSLGSTEGRYLPTDGTKFSYFEEGIGASACNKRNWSNRWWLRSPYLYSSSGPWVIDFGGTGYSNNNATAEMGLRPALAVPSTLLVTDDGSLSVNTAPTTPSSITIPATINSGTTVTVSWGASTDANNNLSGYRLERSTSGGAWTQVYQGTAGSSSQVITAGWTTVAFRVKAYDSEGLESGYATSPTRTINTAPTAPSSITVPATVNTGTTITVSWGASTASQSNLSGYRLERSASGGAWTQVYQGTATSSSQAMTAGWTTVAFRVKAYDSEGLESGYATSPTRTINTAPTAPASITVPDPINTGSTITVSWGAANDAQSNFSGYRLERSASGGAWTQVYDGTALSSAQTITVGWTTVAFRVKAYDSAGLESGYTTSPTRTINTAPAAPASITIPATIKGGESISVSWVASTDAQSNLAGYRLERSVAGAAYTQVYQGTALSSTQAITKGWTTVAFRVKAYDTPGLESAYATSATRTIINNSAPAAPGSIIYPTNPRSGKSITLTCGAATDPDGEKVSYVWERRVDSGNYIQIGITTTTTINDTVPASGTYYQARVKATDPNSTESAYTTGVQTAISYNDPPMITGSDQNLGNLTATGLTYSYTVTDDKTANLAVVIRLDGAIYQSLSAVPGVAQSLKITGEAWQKILNGNHTLTIIATDAENTNAVRTLTFSKDQTVLEFKLRDVKSLDVRPYRLALNLSAQLPVGTVTRLLACNNALDAAPVWEDITTQTLSGRAHIFENITRTAANWAVDLHVLVKRGTAQGDCAISGFTYAFESDGGASAQMQMMSIQLENNEQLLDMLLTQTIPSMLGGGEA